MVSDIPTILEELKQGRMVILVDEEDREKQADEAHRAERHAPVTDSTGGRCS